MKTGLNLIFDSVWVVTSTMKDYRELVTFRETHEICVSKTSLAGVPSEAPQQSAHL
jgi:hypothetical protein